MRFIAVQQRCETAETRIDYDLYYTFPLENLTLRASSSTPTNTANLVASVNSN